MGGGSGKSGVGERMGKRERDEEEWGGGGREGRRLHW